jgi:hypothetical protein
MYSEGPLRVLIDACCCVESFPYLQTWNLGHTCCVKKKGLVVTEVYFHLLWLAP